MTYLARRRSDTGTTTGRRSPVSSEPSARRIQPAMAPVAQNRRGWSTDLATCSFADYRPEMGRPIRISLARPKYRTSIESDDRLSALTPHPSYFRASPEEFDRRYLAQLDRVGVERLRRQFQALDDGRPLILLCFEWHPSSGADCHRRRFAEYWELHTGQIIPEIGGRPAMSGGDRQVDIAWLDRYGLALSSLGVRLDLVANELWQISRELQALAGREDGSSPGIPPETFRDWVNVTTSVIQPGRDDGSTHR